MYLEILDILTTIINIFAIIIITIGVILTLYKVFKDEFFLKDNVERLFKTTL